ncbi:glycosyltransferase [Mucilaginibacter sp.]|uniref:glycosyltransferase n=1 Tax=Mucilaginibacter sp. TaxID=1882438 RepID=UPI003D147704
MEPGISVILCCYNSSLRLPETIKHLAGQQVSPNIPWEVIVVNNASTDNTREVARQEWAKYNVPHTGFTILDQPTPGKNYAFKTGVNHAKYAYVLTCDDDNWLAPNYIEKAFGIMSADPKIGALGAHAVFAPQEPLNKEIANFTNFFVNGPQTWVAKDHWVYGAGSVYRKSILQDLFNNGWQQVTTGRTGTSLICGEDVEICFMIYLSGYKIVADDKLLFKHFVPAQRQKLAYIVSLSFWLSYTNVLLNSYFAILNNDERPIKQIMDNWFKGATKTLLKQTLIFGYYKTISLGKPTAEQQITFNKIYGTWSALFKNRKRVIDHHNKTKALLAIK